jgi:hypothetical protein
MNIETALSLANHVELHFDKYEISNAVNGSWLITNKKTDEKVPCSTEKLSFTTLSEAIKRVQILLIPEVHIVSSDPSWSLEKWEEFIKILISKYGRNVKLKTNAGHSNVDLEVEIIK